MPEGGARVQVREATSSNGFRGMSRRVRRSARGIAIAAVLVASAVGAASLPPLSQEAHVNGALMSAAIGDRIRKECPTISPRLWRVLREAQALKSYARGQGYSEAEIDAFIDSKSDKERIKAAAERWLRDAGAVKGDAQSYCAVGLREIERQSLTGYLLRAQ